MLMPYCLKTILKNTFKKIYLVLCHRTVFLRFNIIAFSLPEVRSCIKLPIYLPSFFFLWFVKGVGTVVEDVTIGKEVI